MSDEQKLEFFLAASHQLKSPLAIMQWCIQSGLEFKDTSAELRDLLETANRQAEAMSHLIADMLNIFRHQETVSQLVSLDLGAVVREAVSQRQPAADQKKVQISMSIPAQACMVMADQTYLSQAVINLVDNAIKYSPNGGMVWVNLERKGREVIVTVTDQGIGLTEVDKAHLFQEFYRSPEARKAAHEGTGLGLVLVKKVIESYGGSVEADGGPGKGATFHIRMPAA